MDLKEYLTIIRNLLDNLGDEGLDKKKFLLTINNLKSSDEVVKFYANENIKKNVCFSKTRNQVIINNIQKIQTQRLTVELVYLMISYAGIRVREDTVITCHLNMIVFRSLLK